MVIKSRFFSSTLVLTLSPQGFPSTGSFHDGISIPSKISDQYTSNLATSVYKCQKIDLNHTLKGRSNCTCLYSDSYVPKESWVGEREDIRW